MASLAMLLITHIEKMSMSLPTTMLIKTGYLFRRDHDVHENTLGWPQIAPRQGDFLRPASSLAVPVKDAQALTLKSRDDRSPLRRAIDCGPRRKPWDKGRRTMQAPQGATDWRRIPRIFCRHYRGSSASRRLFPTAGAVGHIMAPLPRLAMMLASLS